MQIKVILFVVTAAPSGVPGKVNVRGSVGLDVEHKILLAAGKVLIPVTCVVARALIMHAIAVVARGRDDHDRVVSPRAVRGVGTCNDTLYGQGSRPVLKPGLLVDTRRRHNHVDPGVLQVAHGRHELGLGRRGFLEHRSTFGNPFRGVVDNVCHLSRFSRQSGNNTNLHSRPVDAGKLGPHVVDVERRDPAADRQQRSLFQLLDSLQPIAVMLWSWASCGTFLPSDQALGERFHRLKELSHCMNSREKGVGATVA